MAQHDLFVIGARKKKPNDLEVNLKNENIITFTKNFMKVRRGMPLNFIFSICLKTRKKDNPIVMTIFVATAIRVNEKAILEIEESFHLAFFGGEKRCIKAAEATRAIAIEFVTMNAFKRLFAPKIGLPLCSPSCMVPPSGVISTTKLTVAIVTTNR